MPGVDLEAGRAGEHFIQMDWRELEPYFRDLQECASFWISINLVGDMVYSTLILLVLLLKSHLDSPFFQGMQSHINPVLMYLILSIIVNYGALKANQANQEKRFVLLSFVKGLLFGLTFGPFLYLLLSDVQDYFGDFWTSFVVILGCYNGTSAISLWSMFILVRFIRVNESAQTKQRLIKKTIYGSEDSGAFSSCICDKCRGQKSAFLNPSFERSPVWTVFKNPEDIEGRGGQSGSGRMEGWMNFEGFNWGSIDDISNFKISL